MVLEKDSEEYKALQEVIGPENISVDPLVLDGYIWQWTGENIPPEIGSSYMPFRPEAVVLPESTEEVQGVVKVCNRYGLKFKAHSTGWIAFAAPLTEGVVVMDLRRMNRILEINTKDMYAVVEPYVSFAQLQAEIMPKGLNCVVNGAGNHCSVLANVVAGYGAGYANYTMGYNSRNILGVEWVLPDGEILRLGSLGSGSGWICGDGPGPSLRGILRGHLGSLGGFGVFTKGAVRVYHWPGPPKLPVENINPVEEKLVEYPENIAMYWLAFDEYEKRDEALAILGEEDVGYAAGFMGRGLALFGAGDTNRDSVDLREMMWDGYPSISFLILIAANSKKEFEHQKKVVEKVLEETGGRSFEVVQLPPLKDYLTLHLIKSGLLSAHTVCGKAGTFLCTPTACWATRRTMSRIEKRSNEMKKKYIEKGLIADDGGEGIWGVVMDHSYFPYIENLTQYDPTDPESVKAHLDLQDEMNEETIERLKYLSFPSLMMAEVGKHMRSPMEKADSLLCHWPTWLRKVREGFDTYGSSDTTPSFTLPIEDILKAGKSEEEKGKEEE